MVVEGEVDIIGEKTLGLDREKKLKIESTGENSCFDFGCFGEGDESTLTSMEELKFLELENLNG